MTISISFLSWRFVFSKDFYRYDTYLNDKLIPEYASDKFHIFFEQEIPKIEGCETVLYTFCDCNRGGILHMFDYAPAACTVTYSFSPEAYKKYHNLQEEMELCKEPQYSYGDLLILPYCEIEGYRVYVLYEKDAYYPEIIEAMLLNDELHTVSFCCIYDTSLDYFNDENDYKEWIINNTGILKNR